MANAADSSQYKGEYWWTIKGAELTQMLDATNEQKFTSETFTMASLNWCLDVYPNGHKDNNVGAFKVFLKLLSLPPKGTKIIICRRIYCQETESSLTSMTTYEKYGCWGWLDYIMSLDECKKLQLQQLSLLVQVRVVRIINQFNGQNIVNYSYLNHLNKISKRKVYEWNIDEQLIRKMKNSHSGKRFESPIYDDLWCLQICPNKEHSFDVYLQICIPEMGVQWKLNCKQFEINTDYTNIFNINASEHWIWGNNRLSFTRFKNTKLDALQFQIDIEILSMFDDYQSKLSATKMRKYFIQPEFKFKYMEKNTLEEQLYKRGKFNKGWKERFFVVNRTKQTIEYYSSFDDRKQQRNMCGLIDLGAVSRIELISTSDISVDSLSEHPGIYYNNESKSDKQYTFQLITKKRTYIFAAYNKESLLKWLIYLDSCLYGQIIHEGWMEMTSCKPKSHEFKFEFKHFTLNKFQQIKYYNFDKTLKKILYNQSCSDGTIDCKCIERVNIYANPPQNCEYYLFEVHTKSKSYIFGAITQIDRSDWMELINIMKAKDWKYQLEEIEQNDYNEQKTYYNDNQLAITKCQDLIDISEAEFQRNKNNKFVQMQYKDYITYAKFCVMSGKKEYDFESDWLWKEYVKSNFCKNKQHKVRQCDFLTRRIVSEPQGLAGKGFIKWANIYFPKMGAFKPQCMEKTNDDFDKMCEQRRVEDLIVTANAKLARYSENDVIWKKLISFAMYCNLQKLDFYVPDFFRIGSERFADSDYKKKKRLFDIDSKCEEWDCKTLLHTIHHVVALPESAIGKKFKIWCEKYKNTSDFERIRNDYKQKQVDEERKREAEEKKRREEYNKMKANQNEETDSDSEVGSNEQIAKNNKSSSSSNRNDIYPALYCMGGGCGFGHSARDCGNCGKRMLKNKLKVKAYLCTKCGIGAFGRKCIKCGKPVLGRSVQAYLCSSKCGFGHEKKKCVKCGARVWQLDRL